MCRTRTSYTITVSAHCVQFITGLVRDGVMPGCGMDALARVRAHAGQYVGGVIGVRDTGTENPRCASKRSVSLNRMSVKSDESTRWLRRRRSWALYVFVDRSRSWLTVNTSASRRPVPIMPPISMLTRATGRRSSKFYLAPTQCKPWSRCFFVTSKSDRRATPARSVGDSGRQPTHPVVH
ncbi:hypothetical protein GY45DRAFT_58372 [Cubamyces sp. BRFM 1775]|nr:hypothetical protein GY45DRAFT_58372 [Cubamyces sp. BRFM 1775]